MRRLIANRRFPYAGRFLEAGEKFVDSEAHALLMIAGGQARDDDTLEPPSEEPVLPEPAEQPNLPRAKGGRFTKRSDARAEG